MFKESTCLPHSILCLLVFNNLWLLNLIFIDLNTLEKQY